MSYRIGFGYDVHRLADGEKLVLGGIDIPFTMGTIAHSDGDILIHAVIDALLGAANLGDIGLHFPDTSVEFKGADSTKLLKKTIELIREKGYKPGNIDCTICAQKPKLQEYIPGMKKILAQTMNISEEDVSVKATTTEKLGFEGRGEGISVYAVVLLFCIH